MSDTLLVLTLLRLGDGEMAYLEAKRTKNNLYTAKALALKGDTNEAIMLLTGETCDEKRYKLVLTVAKFMQNTAYELLNDSTCFSEEDKVLVDAHFLRFGDHPLSDTLRGMLPKLLNPSLALVISLIPGMGMVYAGRPWQGIKTFLANVVGIGGIVYSIKNKHYVDAAVWYFFWENRFYFGGFQNTLEAVWEENTERLRPYFEYIQKRLEGGVR